MPTLFLIVFVDLVGFGLVIPLLPFYALRFAAAPQQVAVLLAIYSLMQLFAAPLWGRLSDRVGRRPVLMISMAASVLAYLWIGSATALWMPRLEPEVAAEIEGKRLTFGQARDGQVPPNAKFAPIGGFKRSMVRRWLEAMDRELGPVASWMP